MPTATGSFDVTPTMEPPFEESDGVSLGRARFDKQFRGALEATSVVHMTSVGTPVEGSMAYVAVERISGSLDGRQGSFVVLHQAVLDRGTPDLTLTVVPDSGTGALAGLRGTMSIDGSGAHTYTLDYEV